MPSQRKRIGFLPSLEVQNIIDKICNHNKLSQSKVTGILVEEALRTRGVLNRPKHPYKLDNSSNYFKSFNPLVCFSVKSNSNPFCIPSLSIDVKNISPAPLSMHSLTHSNKSLLVLSLPQSA